jgi:CYTH domain-containing protein
MGVEIERKFLVDPSLLPPLGRGVHFRQGYLATGPTVRLRIAGDRAELTIKGPGLLVRSEFNYSIPVADAEAMWPLVKTGLEKRRYHVEHAGKTWEVDEFFGSLAGFWMSEIELVRPDEPFEKPLWTTREVSGDPRYSNASLAAQGRPPEDPTGAG